MIYSHGTGKIGRAMDEDNLKAEIIDGRYGFSHGVHILADLGCPLLMAKRLLHEALN